MQWTDPWTAGVSTATTRLRTGFLSPASPLGVPWTGSPNGRRQAEQTPVHPRNPMGRTGLRGRGGLSCFGPNHTLQPVVTRWRRNQDGAICRRSIKKVLEVLVVKHALSEHWALPGGSQEPGKMLPRKLKQVLQREFWLSFESLLMQGVEVYKGYVDDPRNTDNAWIETVAVSVHFPDQSDVELKRLNSHLQACDPAMSIRWQVVDKRIPLCANHKAILQKVAALFGAYY
ncbi:transient receptor potential cation channel subfamily M member 2 isoform 8-T14 [Molossus nigricans]